MNRYSNSLYQSIGKASLGLIFVGAVIAFLFGGSARSSRAAEETVSGSSGFSFYNTSPLPTSTFTPTPGPPTDTPTFPPPTDTPTFPPPTDTPTFPPPTDTPTPPPPTDTPTPEPPTYTPTPEPPTNTPTPIPPTNTPIPNNPPELGPISVNPPDGVVQIGVEIIFTAVFTDFDVLDTHSATWNWGDGSGTNCPPKSEVCEVDQFNDEVTGSHNYSEPGVYIVSLLVTDSAGASDMEKYEFVIIYDPSAGFVTGGGWIVSAPGAYVPELTLTGKATFGFVSRYKKGAIAPTGNTQFQFKTANLNFHSDSYQWLLVTGGNYARFKGSGTINSHFSPNLEPFEFMVWAGDGDPDTFRIKIWYEDVDSEVVVYDNGFDQAIGNGSIEIHDGK